MNGLYVDSIMVAVSLFALVAWLASRSDVHLYGQAEIALLWTVIMAGLNNPSQSSVLFTQQDRNPALAAASSDNPGFSEELIDTPQQSGQQLSQTARPNEALGSGVLENERQITPGPLLGLYTWTAVYDISEHTVYLPDGTKLEAHSGKGNRLDDPRYVQERMRGATPPNVYELALREKTFHGVQALRLKPVSGGNTFGRSGLLAHTYMLGPRGESNGCVVFKNYNVFLQAFQNGQVKQLIVVDNLKVRNGYELTLAQASFAPVPLKISTVQRYGFASVALLMD